MTDTLQFHPVANIFPLMEGKPFEDLCDSIQQNGLMEGIWIYKGQIIDGRNRYRACRETGVEARFRAYEGEDADLVGFVVALNLHRRHLDESQRGLVHAKIATLPRGGVESLNLAIPTQAQAAELLNISVATGRHGKRVIESGTPELVQAVEKGAVAVSTAAVIATAPKEEQRKIIAADDHKAIVAAANKIKREAKAQKKQERLERREKVPEDLPPQDERFGLYHCSLTELRQQYEGPVDVIITDPPYPKEFLPVYEDLARLAAEVLPDGGSCVVMVGQSYLPEIIAAMSKHLNYHWTLAYLTPGGQATQLWDRKVNTFWKPLLWFTKGEYKGQDWQGDVCKSAVNDNDKQYHHWGQSESGMEDIIRRFSTAGQTILDPFMGAGTTGVVAVKMNRLFVGCDIDPECITTASDRLIEVSHVA